MRVNISSQSLQFALYFCIPDSYHFWSNFLFSSLGKASCCYDEPYNPDASTCVNGGHSYFHVEVEVPLIDGITRVFWGNDTAYLVTQAFECGGSLHYYGANTDNACCADGKYLARVYRPVLGFCVPYIYFTSVRWIFNISAGSFHA